MSSPIVSGGWQVAADFADTPGAGRSPHFYAVYEGGAFGHPERGILAVLALGHAAGPEDAGGAGDAAQLAVHGFAEGYFGARRSFGAKRAADLAVNSINAWLFGQIRSTSARRLAPVSLTALLFHGGSIGVVQIGAARAFRCRQNEIVPLLGAHVRSIADGGTAPVRAVGRDMEISLDYDEMEAQAGDRFLLVSGRGELPPAREPAFRLEPPGDGGCAVRLEVLAAPAPDAAARQRELAALPLRPPPREGDVWDGFTLGRTLYRGRYTVLRLARDEIGNREVVLKIPLRSMLSDEIFAAGFMREAWIGSTVRGSNVAHYIELPPERRSSLYLVLPYYDGETLERRLNRAPPMSLPDGVGIALKLCEAVQDLAAIQIVHRDLKPDNVMLLPGNEVRLLDLGLAYLPGIDMRDAVKPGGTLRYMAPELLQGVQANARSEVYALAVTLYRMFAGGAYPFGQREGLPLQRLRPDLPGWLGKILHCALAQNPVERYADAAEMARALREGLVHGEADSAVRRRFPQFTELRFWQVMAAFFAAGFFILLARALR